MELSRRLKAARALSGKKARELADEVGISKQKLYRLERGDQIPDVLELAAIAAATGQQVDYFIQGSSSSSEEQTISSETSAVKGEAAA